MVIVDTSVWIPFFNRPDSPEKAALDLLIDAEEVVLVGVVLAELLQGCRMPVEREALSDVPSWLYHIMRSLDPHGRRPATSRRLSSAGASLCQCPT